MLFDILSNSINIRYRRHATQSPMRRRIWSSSTPNFHPLACDIVQGRRRFISRPAGGLYHGTAGRPVLKPPHGRDRGRFSAGACRGAARGFKPAPAACSARELAVRYRDMCFYVLYAASSRPSPASEPSRGGARP